MANRTHSIALGALLLALGNSALANDFTAGGTPADLVPVPESRIAMQSEDIVMEYSDGEWLVTADYVFRNSSPDSITQQIGFPELHCDPNAGYDCVVDSFKNLKTTVDGKAAAHRKGQISEHHAWSKDLGTVWLFDASFAPNGATKISHKYQVFTGSNLSWIYDIHYVVETGRGWAGNIGSARFRVQLPPAAHTVYPGDYPDPPRLVENSERPYFLLERVNQDWVPPKSIGTAFVFTSWSDINERLGDDRFARSGVKKEDECTSPYEPETAAQAQMCKNLIYAISGYQFKNEKLKKYFYGNPFDWRREKDPYGDERWVRGLRPFAGFKPTWIPALDRSFLRHLETLKFSQGDHVESLPSTAAAATTDADRRADEKVQRAMANPEKAGPKHAPSLTTSLPPNRGATPPKASPWAAKPNASAAPPSPPKPVTEAPKPTASAPSPSFCSTQPRAPTEPGLTFGLLVLAAILARTRRSIASSPAPQATKL